MRLKSGKFHKRVALIVDEIMIGVVTVIMAERDDLLDRTPEKIVY